MPFARLAARDLDVLSFEEQEPEIIGHEGRSASGRFRSDIYVEKRKFVLVLAPESGSAQIDGIRADIALGAQLPFTGDCIGGATITVRGYLRSIPYVRDGVSFIKDGRLELVQV